MRTETRRIVPMASVADVPRSIAFYAHLGFAVENDFTPADATAPSWAWLESAGAALMVTQACDPVVPAQQAVLFYLYVEDVAEAHQAFAAAGLAPGPIETPFYAPQGEFRLADPDGYCLMISHI